MIKLGIGTPVDKLEVMRARTSYSLLTAILHTQNVAIQPLLNIGCYIHLNRDSIVQMAFDTGCTHLLQVDSDMMMLPDSINKLLAHDLDIVGCNYNKTTVPPEPIIKDGFNGKVSSVPFVPTGFLLVKMDVFKKIGKPWFSFDDGAESEDVYFCDKAIKNGYKVYCDPNVQVGHLGTAVF